MCVRANAGILFSVSAWGRPTRRGDFMSPRSGVAAPPKPGKDKGGRPTPTDNLSGFRRVNVNLTGLKKGARPKKEVEDLRKVEEVEKVR